jgi:hypothetical protein
VVTPHRTRAPPEDAGPDELLDLGRRIELDDAVRPARHEIGLDKRRADEDAPANRVAHPRGAL